METDVKRTQQKITYATMTADRMEDLHRELDTAIERVKSAFGKSYPMVINGREVKAAAEFDDRSPIDTRILLGRFQSGGRQEVRDAIAAARAAFPAWSARRWQDRVAMLKHVADKIRDHRWELSALMGYEAGKNRLECVGDVEESADLIEYYCDQVAAHHGFETKLGTLGPGEENYSVLRPYGVWAVISPFNFPLALAAGPSGGALVAGNTVVFKPASVTPLLGYKLLEMMRAAGIPDGVFNFVTGGGGTAGQELIDNKDIDGIVFTGSKDVGMHLIRDNATRAIPRPLIIEMGGKNPAIVMRSADLDKATDGVWRSAFGAQGQKCSACSRVYVTKAVRDEFVRLLVEKTKKIKIGNPLNRDVYLGPVINEDAVKTFERAVAQAQQDGGKILTGGRRLTDGEFAHGYFVEPTIIDGLPTSHPLFAEELFVPITVVGDVMSLDEAIDLANGTEYGLTAGIFSEDDREIQQFFDRVHAGVTYANRRAGATTGAWPGINSFGGWKASGSTGRGTGGPYYVQQFMREQSRVRIR
ncbi:MAG TPA: aldehyde dehydrogenase family protein [Vicinamibacterales bacterium]|nr:aldehyde dehydrogenase family protein [Vicinamibacterales bacterium]